VFPVDARLRPQGREGELVTTPEQLSIYFARHAAQPWEAISYLRLRLVAGDPAVAEQVLAAAREGIAEVAQRSQFDGELADMRNRLEAGDAAPNFKSGPGGIYDIDYLAGRMQAKHRVWGGGNLAERIALLRHHQLLGEEQARTLTESARFLRTLEHFIRLVSSRAGKWLPVSEHANECVTRQMASALGQAEGRTVSEALTDVLRRTRAIYLEYQF
jgi:glutamate-ammonia-ligase adenylyltransferase